MVITATLTAVASMIAASVSFAAGTFSAFAFQAGAFLSSGIGHFVEWKRTDVDKSE